MKKDISEKVEKMESIEKKLGIKISGIYCEMEFEDNEYKVSLSAEVTAEDDALENSIEIKMAVYDEKNRVVAEESTTLYEDDFSGFDTLNLSVYNLIQKPEKIKIFPKKS